MRILIAANNSMGLYIFRRDLMRRFVKDGHQVFASLPDGEATERIIDLDCAFIDTDIDRRGLSIRKDLSLLIKYFKILKEVQPDLVVTYTIKPNIYCGTAAKLLGIPYAINITGLGTAFQKEGLLKRFARFLYKFGCDKAKVVFTENPGIKQELLEMDMFSDEQITVLNGAGVNTEFYEFHAYPEDRAVTKFLFLGRIMNEKGINELICASKRLVQEGENIELHVAGFFEDDYDRTLFDQCVSEKLIVFHGYLDDVRPLIWDTNCFVLPSYHEGMANTLLECGAVGRPLITSNIHGCMEAVEEGVNGFTCEIKNADVLFETMKRFVHLPYESKKAMGEHSRSYVCKHFDKNQVVEATVSKLY